MRLIIGSLLGITDLSLSLAYLLLTPLPPALSLLHHLSLPFYPLALLLLNFWGERPFFFSSVSKLTLFYRTNVNKTKMVAI